MHHLPQRLHGRLPVVVALVVSIMMPLLVPSAEAAGFQSAYIRLDRMMASTATGGTVCANPATASTENDVRITFPTGYTVNSTAANWVVNSTNLPSGSTFWLGMTSGSTTASNVTGQVVTFPSGNLSPGTLYCFNFVGTSTLTTATAGVNQQGSIETRTSGPAQIDYTQIALTSIANDQILVSAVVPPTFAFVLSGNTDTFSGNLDPLSVLSTSGRTVTITTNAKGGWIAWVKDSVTSSGLFSTAANYRIPSSASLGSDLAAGTENFVLDVDATTDAAGGCTLAIDAAYNGSTALRGGALNNVFQPIASCTGTSPATANGDVITLIERAAIAGSTPAGADYSDTLTVVGAGNF